MDDESITTSTRLANAGDAANAAAAEAASPGTSAPNQHEKSEMTAGNLILTPAVKRSMTLGDDEPQVLAASAPPPPAEAWEREPFMTPHERAATAKK